VRKNPLSSAARHNRDDEVVAQLVRPISHPQKPEFPRCLAGRWLRTSERKGETMTFTIRWPSPPKVDNRRTYYQRPQLSPRDCKILEQARRHGIIISFKDGETAFSCGGHNLPRLAVLRLSQLEYLVPGDGGLFSDSTPQRFLVNITR
jgi:hypothetical protein